MCSGSSPHVSKPLPSAGRYLRAAACLLWTGKQLQTNQFSVTEYWSRISKGRMQMPAVFFVFDLAPINVTIRDERGSFLHFLVRTCAVVGGVFAVTGKFCVALEVWPCNKMCHTQTISCDDPLANRMTCN